MAKNSVFAYTRTRSLPVAADTKSGDPVIVGGLVGVALTDRQGDTGSAETGNPAGHATVALDGAFDLEVTGALAAIGTKVYITPAGALTATESTNTLFGYALATKGSGAGIVTVEIAQV